MQESKHFYSPSHADYKKDFYEFWLAGKHFHYGNQGCAYFYELCQHEISRTFFSFNLIHHMV